MDIEVEKSDEQFEKIKEEFENSFNPLVKLISNLNKNMKSNYLY